MEWSELRAKAKEGFNELAGFAPFATGLPAPVKCPAWAVWEPEWVFAIM